MFPQTDTKTKETPYQLLCKEFVADVRSQLSTLSGEIAQRNKIIQQNDAYVYGDLLQRSLHVAAGHDFTPVNWLRRVAEIHRTQTLGAGFTVTSSYHGVDVDSAYDPNAKGQLDMVNNKKKTYAESRNKLFEAILRDNGGEALFARMVENASVIGDTVLKGWYDEDDGKYKLDMVEAVEHFYAVWNQDNFREYDFTGYVYQISKQEAANRYQVPDTIATSPLGMPLAVLSSANTVEYISTQPMVTVMEVNGNIQGWKSSNGIISKCKVGNETEMNVIIVGDTIERVIDDVKYLPRYYIFPNKVTRRRPWGLPDITESAININQTYIETLSDWRTVASKVNFPKYKAFGFGLDVQLPAPKARTVEMIALGEGQDIVPVQSANGTQAGEMDFQRQLQELKEAFVRETGISAQLFDLPDAPAVNSNQTSMIAMKSISDQVEARRQLWEPLIIKVMNDALDTLSHWDSSIKEIVSDDDWYTRVSWPPALRKDDPSFVTMVLNQTVMGFQSLQTLFERLGFNSKEEIDRINDEMDNPITAAIHGRMLGLLAEYKIAGPPSSAPPKINVSLRGDLTPQQETNLSVMHDFGSGPIFGPTSGPQGELGIRATDDAINTGMISGQGYSTGQPVISTLQKDVQGQPIQQPQQGGQQPGQQSAPQTLTPPTGNTPGAQVASAPGSGQPTANSPQGNINQQSQRRGKR
jgi:hypothetical protein